MGWSIIALLTFMFFVPSFSRETAESSQSFCDENERAALLQFKQSFFINDTACSSSKPTTTSSAYPRVVSWEDGGDCCSSWDGVECGGDDAGHHVIGLDLSSSCLYGSIGSSSALFRLVHLRRLDLANNDFNHSHIPSALGKLTRLTHLNLSYSSFSGLIPPQVLELSQLISLDLSGNPSTGLLKPGLTGLVQSLTHLRELHLSYVSISSAVPDILANLSALTSLHLEHCGLHGEFPREIFHLPNLRSISLHHNPNLTGFLPEFRRGSPLEELKLEVTSFYGKLPDSIGNLNSLNWLGISYCNFAGSIPASMANLTQLAYLNLSASNFNIQDFPSWIGKLSQLTDLGLSWAQLKGQIPPSLANLTKLSNLSLRSNQVTGQIPSWFTNLTHLNVVDISQNMLHGPIPDSIFPLLSLQRIYLDHNNLSGAVELDKFTKLRNLTHLSLSHNKLSVLTNTISNASFPKMKVIGLGSCNLSKFPDFLRSQDELEWLNLAGNNLVSLELDSDYTERTSIPPNEQQPIFLPWKRLQLLTLIDNKLRGFLPIPPPSTYVYDIGNNHFTGNLPPQLCNLTLLYVFDVSNNNLSGTIPPCFGSFSNNLAWLNLKGNNFHGTIPQTFKSGNHLRSIDLSENQFQGQLPRSLANCKMLEILDISNNEISDDFPEWLGVLPDLKIIVLRSNRFHGIVGGVGKATDFPKLRIIDLSYNRFSGNLPAEYFQNWNAMKVSERENSTYMLTSFSIQTVGFGYGMLYTTKLVIKGVEMAYQQILDTFAVIDLSCNRFDGVIPQSIGELKGLQLLNLSKNYFMGPIPPSLGNLMELESLDISHNMFSGQIPVQLTQLTFLGFFNASYNNLSGVIPHGKQFDTFPNTSYKGNSRLCGNPLSKRCGNSETSGPTPTTLLRDIDKESSIEFDWVVTSMGYTSGLVIGVVIGHTLTTRKHEWFVKKFGRKQWRHKKRR